MRGAGGRGEAQKEQEEKWTFYLPYLSSSFLFASIMHSVVTDLASAKSYHENEIMVNVDRCSQTQSRESQHLYNQVA